MSRPAALAALPLLLAAATACDGGRGGPPPPVNAASISPVNVAYRCRDGRSPVVRYHAGGGATVRLSPERAVELVPDPTAASGARYAGGGVTLWAKGEEATLVVDGAETTCKEYETD